jgi:hypothetical protein
MGGMADEEYRTVFGVVGNEVVEAQACRIQNGWVVRDHLLADCLSSKEILYFVESEKLHETREGAEERLRHLGPVQTPVPLPHSLKRLPGPCDCNPQMAPQGSFDRLQEIVCCACCRSAWTMTSHVVAGRSADFPLSDVALETLWPDRP